MTTGTEVSLLFTLPLEIRNKVYEELLSPDPATTYKLYHDRKGRSDALNIHPSILRVNKQVYSEAVWILYSRNVFSIDLSTRVVQQCTGGLYPERPMLNPEALLRRDATEASLSMQDGLHGIVESARPRALIYPHCFRRLHHIQICSSHGAIWGSAMGGKFFTHIGGLILEILRILVDEVPVTPVKTSLHIVIEPGFGDGSIFQGKEGSQLLTLLKKVRQNRSVTLEETVVRYGSNRRRKSVFDNKGLNKIRVRKALRH